MMKRVILIIAVLVGMLMTSSADAGWRRRAYRRAYYGYGPNYYGTSYRPYYNGYYGGGYYNSYYGGYYYPRYYGGYYGYPGYVNGYYAAPGVGVVSPYGTVGVGVY